MNYRLMFTLLTAGWLVGSWVSNSQIAAATIDFEQSGDFDEFAKHQQGQFQQARWSASTGVGGGGGLEPFQGQVGHPNHSTHNQPLELTSIGDRIEIKALIRTRSLSQLSDTQSQEFGSVYFSDEPNGFPSHLANTAVAMFDRTNAATRLAGSTIGRAGAVDRFYINFAPGIIQGEWWYELSASLTNLPGAMLGWHIEVTDYGIDGLTRGGLVLGTMETMEDRYHLTSNGSLFGGLSFVKAADNFAVKAIAIPEPASYLIAIWAGLVITFGGRSRI